MQTDNPFEKVLDRLRKVGHCKNTTGREIGPNCMNGAAWYEGVLTNSPFQILTGEIALEQYPERVKEQAAESIPYLGEGTYMYLCLAGMHFNNHPDTTFEDVERVLEKAAIKWEEDQING